MSGLVQTIDSPLEPLGDQLIADVSAAVGLTVPDGAKYAWLQAQDQNLRLRDSGNNPTASNGILLTADGPPVFYSGDLTKVKVIEVTATGALFVSYYKPAQTGAL